MCACGFLQEMNPYSTVTSDQNELDHRYCVLKLHVPYSDLIYSPDRNIGDKTVISGPQNTVINQKHTFH